MTLLLFMFRLTTQIILAVVITEIADAGVGTRLTIVGLLFPMTQQSGRTSPTHS